MTISKRLAWCAMNAVAALMGLLIVTGLYDENIAYPVGGPWNRPVFRYDSTFARRTWINLVALAVVGIAIGVTWWRTGRPR